ncbi:MAG: glycosyltransferase family 2 protein [Candidatus Parcubacteria bacterium]|nr:glycosyltransferase family 2 protein [Candidatus Parcubacteria bacterium]
MSPETQKEFQRPYFFSFIIPAHNEEKYIGETLDRINKLSYPKSAFEVWVIENGSTDQTFDVSKKHAGENVMVLSSPVKGVSRAKNFGMEKLSSRSEWVIFLDADAILEENFLRGLNDFLQKNPSKKFAIGTTAIKPHENTDWYAKTWFRLYDLGHKYTKTSYTIQIMNAALRNKVRFDHELTLAEDLHFITDCLAFGKFFFWDTDTVATSTRRFDQIGWVTLFIKWNWDALVWRINKKKKEYPVIR